MKNLCVLFSLIVISSCNPAMDKRLMILFEEVDQKAPVTESTFFKNSSKDSIFVYPDDPIPTFHKIYFNFNYSNSPDSTISQFFKDANYYLYLFIYHNYLNGESTDINIARQELERVNKGLIYKKQIEYEQKRINEVLNMKVSDKLCNKGDKLVLKLPFSIEGAMKIASYGVYSTDSLIIKGLILDKTYNLSATTPIDTSNIEYRIKITSMSSDTCALYNSVLYKGQIFNLHLREYGKIIEKEK